MLDARHRRGSGGHLPYNDVPVLALDCPPWMATGVCAQTDPEEFFPEKGASVDMAKRICHGCPVQEQCLEYAIEHKERFGVWGGVTERERRVLIKARQVAA